MNPRCKLFLKIENTSGIFIMRIAYKRCSTNEDKQDVARQLFGIDFDKEFVEYASGKNEKNRPIFNECLELVKEGDELYFQDLSRAGRNTAELLLTIEKLTKKNVKVVFISENLTFVGEAGDPMAQATSKLMLTMLSAVNEIFLTQTSIAVKQGQKVARAKGKKIGAASPQHKATYQKNKAAGLHKRSKEYASAKEGRVEIIKKMSDIVKVNPNMLTFQQLADNLNTLGITTPKGKTFSKGTVSRIADEFKLDRLSGEYVI